MIALIYYYGNPLICSILVQAKSVKDGSGYRPWWLRPAQYKRTAWAEGNAQINRHLAEANFILLHNPPHKWDGNECLSSSTQSTIQLKILSFDNHLNQFTGP